MATSRVLRALALAVSALLASVTALPGDERSPDVPELERVSGETFAHMLDDPLWRAQQPDYDEYYAVNGIEPPAGGDVVNYFSYISVAGSALRPRDGSVNWNYVSSGCISLENVGSATVDLSLPDDARIDFLRFYFYDAEASGKEAFALITRYDRAGALMDLGDVESSGSGGFGSEVSPFIGEIVDNLNFAYLLQWNPRHATTDMRLCGLRVAYRLPTWVR